MKPSIRVPCPPCWLASWCTVLSPAFGTLAHSWRVRHTHAVIKLIKLPCVHPGFLPLKPWKFILAVLFLCYTTHLIVSLSNLSHDSIKPPHCGKAFSILSSLDCGCMYSLFFCKILFVWVFFSIILPDLVIKLCNTSYFCGFGIIRRSFPCRLPLSRGFVVT